MGEIAEQMNPEELYQRLGRLVESMPGLGQTVAPSIEEIEWLGKAYALVKEVGDFDEAYALKDSIDELNRSGRREAAHQIAIILYRALAVSETRAPASAQGAFIPAGNAFDSLAAIGKILNLAKSEVLIVDPYMDEKALTDFAILAKETININLLTDAATYKPTLPPAAQRWKRQFGGARPLEVRLSAPLSLHDRLIQIDSQDVFVLTQSLNAFAERSPASIVRVDTETAALKISAYADLFASATAI